MTRLGIGFLVLGICLLISMPAFGYDSTDVVHCIGNAHIDTAWLWPKTEVRDQVIPDSYNNALNMMNANPDYRFSTSASVHYQWAKELYPSMYLSVQNRVASGEWEITGGQVVEPDTNMTSGESHVRQFLYGKRYFKDEFNKDIKIGFVPDCFGFAGSWPQIMVKSGIDFWITSKLTWNDTNQFRRGPFIWKGVDGSTIPTYNLTHNYCPSPPEVNTLRGTLDSVAALGLKESLHLYGWGDHGGGPDQAMIDQVASSNSSAEFTAQYGRVDDYYNNYLVNHLSVLPEVEGELYLEYHRGVLTSQATVKAGNRKSEVKADEAEKLSSIYQWMGGTYPHDTITYIWENVILVNQFHDILPGSSIDPVYKGPDVDGGTDAQYAYFISILQSLINTTSANLANNLDTNNYTGIPLAVVNPLAFQRTDVVEATVTFGSAPSGARVYDSGVEIPSQVLSIDGNSVTVLFIAENVPSLGAKVYHVQDATQGSYSTGLSIGSNIIENNYFRVTLSGTTGHITSLYDKVNSKEAFSADANVLHFFVDEPTSFDAWNLGPDVRDNIYTAITGLDSIQQVEAGPVRAIYKVNKSHSGSTFSQYITLYSGIDNRVDVRMETDWDENKKCLKVAFPVNVSGTQTGTFAPPLSTKWCATGAEPHWLRVDLGADETLESFVVSHAGTGGESASYNTRDFKIQLSPNGSTWSDAVTVTGNTDSKTTHNITPTSARYVRLYITDATSTSDTAARIFDFQAWTSSENVAVMKTATADTYVAGEEPGNAVDGTVPPASTDTVATYEIPYAAIRRSIKRDTSYDAARFEVAGQRWADMSEASADYGVSILNDCKYGYDALDNVLRLTLLKSPTGDPGSTNPADDGFHEFTYSIAPHAGGWEAANTVHKGMEVNYPLMPVVSGTHDGALGDSFSFASSDKDNVIISAVKRAEDDPTAYILRLYESEGAASTAVTITLANPIQEAYEMDMIEWNNIGSVSYVSNQLSLTLTDYDIRTIRVKIDLASGMETPFTPGPSPTPAPTPAPTPTPEPDLTEGGTASDNGTSNPAGEEEDKAFDNIYTTKWLVFSTTGVIQYDFAGSNSHAVNEYRVTSANDFAGRDPKNWNFQGSDNGSSWTTLDTQSNVDFSGRHETQAFPISNSTNYQMYRLQVTANSGDPELQIAEVQMYEASGTPTPEPTPGPATNPSPSNGAGSVSTTADLSWTSGYAALSHDVYFGTSSPPSFVQNQAGTTYDPGTMGSETTYYWRIDEVYSGETITGTEWNFTTEKDGCSSASFDRNEQKSLTLAKALLPLLPLLLVLGWWALGRKKRKNESK
jgi:alpha-mannosidase